jgi:hypothetical protein
MQHYAVKIAGLSLCLRGNELAAAAERLRSERDAALASLRTEMRTRERHQLASVLRDLRQTKKGYTRWQPRRGQQSAPPGQFRRSFPPHPTRTIPPRRPNGIGGRYPRPPIL